jgi:hypothetical protein
MTEITTFQVARDDLSKTRFVSAPVGALQPGEVLLKIDSFAFTANNITYAETGVVLKYWQFFPAPEGWGVIPVWGFADVVESRHEALTPGERLYGYWPMATHAVLTTSINAPQPAARSTTSASRTCSRFSCRSSVRRI